MGFIVGFVDMTLLGAAELGGFARYSWVGVSHPATTEDRLRVNLAVPSSYP